MIDIKFLRENPDIVKQNIKNKFQDEKLPLVDEVIELDEKSRSVKCKGDELRAQRNSLSDQIGNLMRNGQKEEAESVKEQVKEINQKLVENEKLEEEYAGKIKKIMMTAARTKILNSAGYRYFSRFSSFIVLQDLPFFGLRISF